MIRRSGVRAKKEVVHVVLGYCAVFNRSSWNSPVRFF